MFKPPATRIEFLLTDLSPFQQMATGCLPRCFRKRKKCFDIYDDSELLERYRFNRNKILYITDLLHKDLCPLGASSLMPLPKCYRHYDTLAIIGYNSFSRKHFSKAIHYILSSANHWGYPTYNKNRMGFSYLGSCVSITFDKNQC